MTLSHPLRTALRVSLLTVGLAGCTECGGESDTPAPAAVSAAEGSAPAVPADYEDDGSADPAPESILDPVDHTEPEFVVQAIFDAAQNQMYAHVSGLCDPQGENDGDTQNICVRSAELWRDFEEFFADGVIRDETAFNEDGTRAIIPISFGPGAVQPGEITLIQRDGLWYLLDLE